MYILFLLSFVLFFALFINNNLFSPIFAHKNPSFKINNQIQLIEFLTQQKTKEKNYAHPPVEYKEYGRFVTGEIINETTAVLNYKFPLLNNIEHHFTTYAEIKVVSTAVDKFGAPSKYFRRQNDTYVYVPNIDYNTFFQDLNKDGFFINNDKMGIDYNYLLHHSGPVGKQIADDILRQLQNRGLDFKENRVIAACNFVQFIPYGQPEFDKGNYIYYGLSLPYESFILSFCDCDSKSLLLASILIHLIHYENIIFIGCDIKEGAHMIIGISGLNLGGLKYRYNGKEYMLIETTVPHNIEELEYEQIKITDIHPVKATA